MAEPDLMSLKGAFLIAMPELADPNFSETVVAMCEHNREGSLGVVINRQLPSLHAKEIFSELEIPHTEAAGNLPIHYGGPVHMNELFILHGPPFGWEATLEVTPFLAMSNTRDLLEAVAAGEGPETCLIALGCAGWGPEQVESEVLQNVWLNCPADAEILFRLPVEDRWEAAVRKLGIDPALLSVTAGNA